MRNTRERVSRKKRTEGGGGAIRRFQSSANGGKSIKSPRKERKRCDLRI